jgi:polysaccharide pyruvyl transferase WcaK-like protein
VNILERRSESRFENTMSDSDAIDSGRRSARIGLLGQYSSRNLGDAAIVHEIIRNVRSRIPGAEFVGICSRPDDTAHAHGIAAFPVSGHGPAFRPDGAHWSEVDPPPGPGSGTRRIDSVVRSLDLLVMAGGGQVDDYWGGAGEQPRFLATWTVLARLRRVPAAFFCVGLDQLSTRTGRWLSLLGLRSAAFLSFRDAGTRDLLRQMGLRKPSAVYADPAFGLLGPAQSSFRPLRRVVVSPICKQSWPGASDETYERYLRELAQYVQMAIRSGLNVRFVCSQISMDPEAVTRVTAMIPAGPRDAWSVAEVATFEDFVREASLADAVVTSRLHGAILALVAGTPVIAVSVARKVNAVMAEAGLNEYCVEASSVDSARLFALLNKAAREGAEVRQRIQASAQRLAGRLPGAYDALVALVRLRQHH